MQTEVRFICDDVNEAARILQFVGASVATVAAPAVGEADKPSRKPRKVTATETPAAAAAPAAPPVDPNNVLGLPAAAVASGDPLASLGISAGQLPPVAVAMPPPVVAPPPAVVSPAALSQQDVIKAFVALGHTPGKGIDTVKALLVPYGVATVAAIKPEHFAHAIAAVKQALGQ